MKRSVAALGSSAVSLVLLLLLGPAVANGQVLPSPDAARAYEMVTPPDKNNRRAGALGRQLVNAGIPSPNGGALLFGVQNGILDPNAGTAFPHDTDFLLLRRAASGWRTEAINNVPSVVPAGDKPVATPIGFSEDLLVQAWEHHKELFDSGSHLSTRLIDDTGGPLGSGWYSWIDDPGMADLADVRQDSALVDTEGDRIVRWFERYRGLLGPGDPSLGQLPHTPPNCQPVSCEFPGGAAIYMQEPPGTGSRHLVNACTAPGGLTQIPERGPGATADPADDVIAAQTCAVGLPTSKRGAVVGSDFRTGAALSEDGKRVFFMSPDPSDGPGEACAADTGLETNCPAQLFVRQYDSSAAGATAPATVRWISRSQITGQSISLLRPTIYEGASSDGSAVYFRTDAPLIASDPNGGQSTTAGPASSDSWDLYRYDLPGGVDTDPAGGTLTRVTGGPDGTADPNTNDANGAAIRFLSVNGDRAYLVTNSPIAGADATPPTGGVTTPAGAAVNNTTRNLYLYDRSGDGPPSYRFVARIPASSSGLDACASRSEPTGMSQQATSSDELVRRRNVDCVRGLPDGSTIAFETSGQLTAGDVDTAGDIYLYDADEDRLSRVSVPLGADASYVCDHVGATPTALCNADLGFVGTTSGDDRIGLRGQSHANIARDADGEVSLFFESRRALVAEDINGTRMDTYRWHDGELSLISPGDSDHDAWFSGNSRDGRDVYFFTARRIDGYREIDDDLDLYDARVGGGFPPPPPPPVFCGALADACQGGGASERPIGPVTDRPGGGNATPKRRSVVEAKLVGGRKGARRAARTGVLRVRVRGAGQLTVVAKARIGEQRRSVAEARPELPAAGGVEALSLRLSKAARRVLSRGEPLRVTVVVKRPGTPRAELSVVLRRGGGR